jgi:stage V sporulation protein R|tara:strand:+ start:6876 stop:8192 length:1317 start_codon:yes stop_codon:yes gene_type:complete
MADWSMEELQDWDKKICTLGEGLGLNWYPIEYEICDYKEMIGHMAYTGLPTHYRHWSFGKSFDRIQTEYNLGMTGLPYEMIINSNPSISYLMTENPMPTHILTMAHCVGHSDFFKNNRMFSETGADTAIDRFKSSAKRVKKYMEDPSIGVERVEKILDACHAIKYQVPRTPGIKRRDHKELKKYYENLIRNDNTGGYDDFNINKVPLEPDTNLLGFIATHNKMLQDWERDLIHIVEKESLYFIPQACTKIMNEGWACMIHEKIVNALGLSDEYILSFIRLHNQVVRPHLGRVNPYHLGFTIFKYIEKNMGFEECLRVRETHSDETFLKTYLNEELCKELNLFSFSFHNREGYNKITEVSSDETWRTVRDDLIKGVGLNSVPVVMVKELTPEGTLILEHEHDGRDLELSQANKVFEHINDLWYGEVRFTTVIEDETWEF